MDRAQLINALKKADEEIDSLFEVPDRFKLVIVGGSALLLKDIISRQTRDIDVLNGYSSQLEPIFSKYDINAHVAAFIDNLPYNYEDRLNFIDVGTKTFSIFTLSIEDLVLMKLYSEREKDYLDATHPDVVSSVDFGKLKEIVSSGEMDNSFNVYRYKLFLEKFQKYIETYGEKDE